MTVVANGLGNPHNMVIGPDGYLWLTEQRAKRIIRVHPKTGTKSVAVEIADAVHSAPGGHDTQDGVLGLALHPDLLKGKGRDFVYVSFTYETGEGGEFPNRTAIRRYSYDVQTQTLGAPVDIIKGLPSAHDHQGARLLVGPDGKLYYSLGDQGANQLDSLCIPNLAQVMPTPEVIRAGDWRHYAGKILRLNPDGSIPADNPVIHGVRSHIFALGFRNPQGMAFSPDGKLFATDHGPNSDDELNLVLAGKNYGWPYVAGKRDNSGYAYVDYSAAKNGCVKGMDPALNGTKAPAGVPVQAETDWSDPDYVEPLETFFTVGNSYNFKDPLCAAGGLYYICWPTIAPSSLAYYAGGPAGVPGWKDSILITSLKRGVLYLAKLDPKTGAPLADAQPIFRTLNRYREVVVSQDGGTIFVATDLESAGIGTSEKGDAAFNFDNPGSILAFRYAPQ